ncbi:MAG: phosphoribosylanthranilate isomerase [Actinomycetota bacterium]|nr:phosphoribosylanthranilate isomerase [Actinomycetota bacterium]
MWDVGGRAVWVKVCGTTSEEDALLAVAMGADAVGFIFAPSTRQVAPGAVRDIVRRLPPEVVTVGVFRDAAPEQVVKVVNGIGLRAAQLHGRETPEQSRYVAERVPLLIKAFAAGDPALRRAHEHQAAVVMLDAPSPGSGQVFDWRLAEGVPDGCRLVLAGGLNAGNVADAVGQVRPWGVDVVTGVESEPGRKDPRALRAFVEAARRSAVPAYEGASDGPYDWEDEL